MENKLDPIEALARKNCASLLERQAASASTGKLLSLSLSRQRYECKSCNLSFSSFQALGGHKASHKKAKHQPSVSSSDQSTVISSTTSHHDLKIAGQCLPSKLVPMEEKKEHACLRCEARFPTGQALGGHMRRHSGPIRKRKRVTVEKIEDEDDLKVKTKKMDNKVDGTAEAVSAFVKISKVLHFDLNLLPPDDDDDIDDSVVSVFRLGK